MSLSQFVSAAQVYFPSLQVKYKNQSWLMKIISYIMFFNKDFMSYYVTTIGSTVYFPDESFTKMRPVSAPILLMHELVHIYDAQRYSRILFEFLYLCPQLLILFTIPLFFIARKIALVLAIALLLPWPAYFRMYFEKRAYMVSLYVFKALEDRLHFNHNLDKLKDFYVIQFKGSSYYYMWPFKNIGIEFNTALDKIKLGQRPFEDPIFDKLDKLIAQV